MVKSVTQKEKSIQENILWFNKIAKFYDSPLNKFLMTKFQNPVIQEISIATTSETTKTNRKIRILDIGCGTGNLLLRLKTNLKEKVELYGIDISEKMLAIAKNKLQKTVNLQIADAHSLPFKDNYFDYTISTEVFHHYYNQQEAIKEMVRVTKNNGKIIVVDINFFLSPLNLLFKALEPGCIKINSRKEMKQLLQQAGLKIILQKRNFFFTIITIGKKE